MKVKVKLRELNEAMDVKVVEAGVIRSATKTLMRNAEAAKRPVVIGACLNIFLLQ
jgi:hypothetical protein